MSGGGAFGTSVQHHNSQYVPIVLTPLTSLVRSSQVLAPANIVRRRLALLMRPTPGVVDGSGSSLNPFILSSNEEEEDLVL